MAASAWLRPELPTQPQRAGSFKGVTNADADLALYRRMSSSLSDKTGTNPDLELFRRLSSSLSVDLIRISSQISEIFDTGDSIYALEVNIRTEHGTEVAEVCSIEEVHPRIKMALCKESSQACITILMPI